MIKFAIKYPADAVECFLGKLHVPEYGRLILMLLENEAAGPVRYVPNKFFRVESRCFG